MRHDYQGKTKQQVKDSETFTAIAIIGLIVVFILAAIFN